MERCSFQLVVLICDLLKYMGMNKMHLCVHIYVGKLFTVMLCIHFYVRKCKYTLISPCEAFERLFLLSAFLPLL